MTLSKSIHLLPNGFMRYRRYSYCLVSRAFPVFFMLAGLCLCPSLAYSEASHSTKQSSKPSSTSHSFTPPPTSHTSSDSSSRSLSRHQHLSNLTHFTAQGKISFKHGKRGGNATFEWKQAHQNYVISLIGALGAGSLRIFKEGKNPVTLTTSKGEIYKASTPEELLKKMLSWSVPVTPLQYWLRGIPDPTLPIKKAEADHRNRLLLLEQEGWKVIYQSYTRVHNLELPHRMTLERDNIKLRLIFTQWSLGTRN